MLTAPTLDPLVALAFAAAAQSPPKTRHHHAPPGPQRRPTGQAAGHARCAVRGPAAGHLRARACPAGPSVEAVGVPGATRATVMDEMLPLLRRLWAGETGHPRRCSGRFEDVVAGAAAGPAAPRVLDRGMVPAALERVRPAGRRVASLGLHPGRGGPGARGHRGGGLGGRARDQPRAFRRVPRLCRPPARRRDDPGAATLAVASTRAGRPGGDRRASRHDRALPRGGILQVRGAAARDAGLVAGRARVFGRRASSTSRRDPEPARSRWSSPPTTTPGSWPGWPRSPPTAPAGSMSHRSSTRSTTPPEPGPFAFLGGSTHKVPTGTWMPGRRAGNGTREADHRRACSMRSGPRLAWKLRDLGMPVPEGWRITQDHPRRGLVLLVPAGCRRSGGDGLAAAMRPPSPAPSRPPADGSPRSIPGCPRCGAVRPPSRPGWA